MVRAIGVRERVEKPKISVKPSYAAVDEHGRGRHDLLVPMPTIRSSMRGSGGADAHGDRAAQRARPGDAQVTYGPGRADRRGRTAAEVDMPM